MLAVVFIGVATVALMIATMVGSSAKPLVLALTFLSAALFTFSAWRITRADRITLGSVVVAVAAIVAFGGMFISAKYIPRFTREIGPFRQSDELVTFLEDNEGTGVYLNVQFEESKYLDMSKITPAKDSDTAILSFYSFCDRPANDKDIDGYYLSANCDAVSIKVLPNAEVARPFDPISLVSASLKGHFLVVDYSAHMKAIDITLRPISARNAHELS